MSGYMYDCAGFTIPPQARFRYARHAAVLSEQIASLELLRGERSESVPAEAYEIHATEINHTHTSHSP